MENAKYLIYFIQFVTSLRMAQNKVEMFAVDTHYFIDYTHW